MNWPKTETGAVDWETAFEDPAKGLIPLVVAARTPAKTRKITAVLVSGLLLPGSDPAKRAQYGAALAAIMAKDAPPESVQPGAVALLRTIKNDRIAADEASGGGGSDAPGGDEWEDPMADFEDEDIDGDGDEDGDEYGGEDRGAYGGGDDSGEAQKPDPHVTASAEFVMGAFFLRQYDERLAVLNKGVADDFPPPLPYLMSKTFAKHFRSVLMDHFVDRVIDANYAMVKRCDRQAPDKRDAFLEEAFEDINERKRFFERWKGIWAEKTTQQRLPKKPKNPKQTGVLSMLSAKKDESSMSLEEWEAAVAETKAKNETAKEIHAKILAEIPGCTAPQDEDLEILMNLLGRTPGALEKQITAISQIGLQSRSTSAFDRYQQGRPVDLPLLAASFRHPQAFLGPKGFARDLMRGYREAARVSAFPLVSRFIIDAKGEVYTPNDADTNASGAGLVPGSEPAFVGDDGPKDWEPIPEGQQEEE